MERRRILSVSIKDCELQTFRSGGSGGQNQNKRDTGVRLIHHPSGARGEARDERSQAQNKKLAFLRLVKSAKFDLWLKQTTGRIAVIEAETQLDPIQDDDIKVEVKQNGRWVQVPSNSILE